ncbi:TPA: zinc ABC transporter substrate-binding protein [Candidatus Nomurabacteria bacterium]|nr:zinc ABC transporter substrate-binding protein [Candidatus Nomurabacteria bacterium]
MDIFEEIKKLNFPKGEYIVVGSGIMKVKGIRDTNDLDIVVTPELFEKCKNDGWEINEWTKVGIEGKEWLKKGDVDVYAQLSRKNGSLSVEDLLKNSEEINGISFITLEALIDFKREYGRPKDFEDIKMIENYLLSK